MQDYETSLTIPAIRHIDYDWSLPQPLQASLILTDLLCISSLF